MVRQERTAPMRCWKCSHFIDGRTEIPGVTIKPAPVDGDVSLCWYCGAIGIYVGTPPLAIREPRPEEEQAIRAEPRIKELLNKMAVYRIARGGSL